MINVEVYFYMYSWNMTAQEDHMLKSKVNK